MIAVDGRRLQGIRHRLRTGHPSHPVRLQHPVPQPGVRFAGERPESVVLGPHPLKFGYGHSDLTGGPRDVDTVVEEYRRALAACGRPVPVVLAAHSMGFLEALHWASKYPEEVSALVGLDPAVPEVYQHMDLDAILGRLDALNRSNWKRALLFRLLPLPPF